jgi:hypothetical protein
LTFFRKMRTFLTVLSVASVATMAAAECGNACSGHGTCGANDACSCYTNWIGADCSERVCPFGLSFVDTPRGDLNHDGVVSAARVGSAATLGSAANRKTNMLLSPIGLAQVQWSNKLEYEYYGFQTASANGLLVADDSGNTKPFTRALDEEGHYYSECSGKGSCDRAAGQCKCFDGYTGSACQRTTCPNDCSGHGSCLTVREIAAGSRLSSITSGRNYKDTGYFNGYTESTGVKTAFTYDLWDADKNQACACDPGYFGPDCSMTECPRGADPLSTENWHCGNSACTAEKQYFYVKLAATAANTPETTFRFKYTDRYSSDTTYYSDFMTIDFGTKTIDGVTTVAVTARDVRDVLQAGLNSFPKNVLGDVRVNLKSAYDAGAAASVASYLVSSFTPAVDDDLIEFELDFTNGPQGNVNDIMIDTGAGKVTHPSKNIGSPVAAELLTTGYSSGSTDTVVTSEDSAACSAAQTFGAGKTCVLQAGHTTQAAVDGTTGFTTCSDRGVCDHSTGQCQCFTGYTGTACNMQAALAQ